METLCKKKERVMGSTITGGFFDGFINDPEFLPKCDCDDVCQFELMIKKKPETSTPPASELAI
jgi:hypothetical protein